MKCPTCNNEMMALCRRDALGYLNQVYYRCLSCGFVPTDDQLEKKMVHKRPWTASKLKLRGQRWKIATTSIIALLVVVSIMQIPVPVRVFATEISIDPVKDILAYVSLVNFTVSDFSLNYTEGETMLQVIAEYATVKSTETAQNITTTNIQLGKILINYRDPQRTLNMGFASLTMTVTIRYQELIAKIDATTYMPLWSAITRELTGQTA